MNRQITKVIFLLWLVIAWLPDKAYPMGAQIKGVHQLVKPEYPQASLVWGFAALATSLLEYIRLYGNYGSYDGVHPVIYRRDPDGSLAKKDSPLDWVTTFIQFLYPSTGLSALIASTRPSDFTYKMDIATVGRVMQAVTKTDHKNKKLLAGAIYAALKPEVFKQYYEKNLKINPTEVARERALEKLSNEVFRVKLAGNKHLYKKATGFSRLIVEAIAESEKDNSIYPPSIVEVALSAWVWKKASTKKDLLPYFEAMPELLSDKVKFDTDGKITSIVDKDGKEIDISAWLSQEYTPQQYEDFKKSYLDHGINHNLFEKLTNDPEFSAFIGNGHYVYDAKLPPKRIYSNVIHPSLKNEEKNNFSDCGSNSLRSFLEIAIYDSESRKFDINILKRLANKKTMKADIDVEEEEEPLIDVTDEEVRAIKEKSDAFANQNKEMERLEWLRQVLLKFEPIKRLIWYFKTYNSVTKSQAAANDWALITSELEGVKYVKGSLGGNKTCEIDSGISNMLTVVSRLITGHGLNSTGTDKNKSSAAILTKLCGLLSTSEKRITWQSPSGNQHLSADDDIVLTFFINGEKAFNWGFEPQHLKIEPIIKPNSYFQRKFQDQLVDEYDDGLEVYLASFYVDPNKLVEVAGQHPKLLWPMIYSNLYSEKGKKAAISYLFKNKHREHYDLAWNWLNQLPTEDRRIQLFILDTLLMDEYWYKSLDNNHPIKSRAINYLKKLEVYECDRIIQDGLQELFRYMSEKGIITLDAKTINKNKWLYKAADSGSVELVKTMLKLGAKVNFLHNFEGNVWQTPVHVAAENDDLEMLKLLLDAGANPDSIDNVKLPPLFLAHKPEIVKALLDANAKVDFPMFGGTKLHEAVKRGKLDVVKVLLAGGANIDITNKDGLNPLHIAARENHADIAVELLEQGADVNFVSEKKITGLHWAANFGQQEVIEKLIHRGANVLALDHRGKQPHQVAKKQEVRDYLIQIRDNFMYPPADGDAMEYLKYLGNFYGKKNNLPPKMITYWAGQVLSGNQYGIKDEGPADDELQTILDVIVKSVADIEYKPNDRWLEWTIFGNKQHKGDYLEHVRNVYTLTRYSQMRIHGLPDEEIMSNLTADKKAYSTLEVAGYDDIKRRLDDTIDRLIVG